MSNGWDASAAAWIADQGDAGDYGRRYVLDAPMLDRLRGRDFRNALDVGCGEGRFCRMMQALEIVAIGIDPTDALLARARALDPSGDYRRGRAESLEFADASFDLVVSYLTLIDIPDIATATAEIVRVLRPGGTFLLANITSFNSAGPATGWQSGPDGAVFPIDRYLEERAMDVSWRGISIVNYHRPLRTYMQLFLGSGLELMYFDEPAPTGGDPQKADRYRRVPYFHIMEWRLRAGGDRAATG
jgi:SAM-dependent methyltransferase